RDPVADGGEVGAAGRAGAEPRRHLGAELACLRVDLVAAAVLDGDARRREACDRVRLELGCELVRPAQFVQVQLGTSVAREGTATGGGSSYTRSLRGATGGRGRWCGPALSSGTSLLPSERA